MAWENNFCDYDYIVPHYNVRIYNQTNTIELHTIRTRNTKGKDYRIKIFDGVHLINYNPYDDGWKDGPTNEEMKLELTKIKCIKTKHDVLKDDKIYLISDDRRFPGFEDKWKFVDPGDSKSPNIILDRRVMIDPDDDFDFEFELFEWGSGGTFDTGDIQIDDTKTVTMGSDEQKTVRFEDTFGAFGMNEVEYKIWLDSTTHYFADLDPLNIDGDPDGDGISDQDEYQMNVFSVLYGDIDGRAHPLKKDIFVEVDWMTGHEMSDKAKWMVGTRFLNNPTGEEIWLHIDACFTPMNQRFICILGNRFSADEGKMDRGGVNDFEEEIKDS